MTDYPGIFRDVLIGKGALVEIYNLEDGRKCLEIEFENRRFIAFLGGSENDYLSIRYEAMNAPFNKKGEIILLCNKLNSKFKFVKTYIDEDNDIIICCDIHLPEENTAEIAYEAFFRILLYVEKNINVIKDVVYS